MLSRMWSSLLNTVFGSGCALAALAGVIGGITFVTEPNMAVIVGSIIFVVVVVGGVGSLAGAFVGSLLIGMLQTLPLTIDGSLASVFTHWGMTITPELPKLPVITGLIMRPELRWDTSVNGTTPFFNRSGLSSSQGMFNMDVIVPFTIL